MNSPRFSNIELYYSRPENIKSKLITISGEEYTHCIRVMRNSVNDEIYVTGGEGKIYKGIINRLLKNQIEVSVTDVFDYPEGYKNLVLCLPVLKNHARLEFAVEKCTEMGIINFLVFHSSRETGKSIKADRLKKIALAAMKQSLLSYLPQISAASLKEIASSEGEKIILEQGAGRSVSQLQIDKFKKYYFIFGPEGGFTKDELNLFNEENFFSLAPNRLRTETAVIKCCSILTL